MICEIIRKIIDIIQITDLKCPNNVVIKLKLLFLFQILIVLSLEQLTKFPFFNLVNALTLSLWFVKLYLILDLIQIKIVLSSEADAIVSLSKNIKCSICLEWPVNSSLNVNLVLFCHIIILCVSKKIKILMNKVWN